MKDICSRSGFDHKKLGILNSWVREIPPDELAEFERLLSENLGDADWCKRYGIDHLDLPRDGINYARYVTMQEYKSMKESGVAS